MGETQRNKIGKDSLTFHVGESEFPKNVASCHPGRISKTEMTTPQRTNKSNCLNKRMKAPFYASLLWEFLREMFDPSEIYFIGAGVGPCLF